MYSPSEILLYNNGLFMRLLIDRASSIGKKDLAGLSDISMEGCGNPPFRISKTRFRQWMPKTKPMPIETGFT